MCFQAARGKRAGQLPAHSGAYSEPCRTRVAHHRLRPALQLAGVGQAAVHHQVRHLRWAVTIRKCRIMHSQRRRLSGHPAVVRGPRTSRKLDCSASCSMG